MKSIVYVVVLLAAIGAVSAASHGSFPGGFQGFADHECTENGYSHAVAKWEWKGSWASDSSEGFSGASVNGTRNSFDWNALSTGADGIVVRLPGGDEAEFPYVGANGHVDKAGQVSHVVFCESDDAAQVPEFSTIASGIAIAGAGAAFLLLRKRS